MKYLLIYWLIVNPSLPATTGNVVLDDQPSCEQALTALTKTWPNAYRVPVGICVPQGQSPEKQPGCILGRPDRAGDTVLAPCPGFDQ